MRTTSEFYPIVSINGLQSFSLVWIDVNWTDTTAATRFAECPHALGKGTHALSKSFAECNTRQRGSVEPFHGKACFAECQISGTRQRLCWVSSWHSVKDWRPLAEGSRRLNFFLFPCQVQHSAKNFLFFSKFFVECHSAEALGKACFYFFKIFFAECHCQGTRQRIFYFFLNFLCRVQWPLHSANLGK